MLHFSNSQANTMLPAAKEDSVCKSSLREEIAKVLLLFGIIQSTDEKCGIVLRCDSLTPVQTVAHQLWPSDLAKANVKQGHPDCLTTYPRAQKEHQKSQDTASAPSPCSQTSSPLQGHISSLLQCQNEATGPTHKMQVKMGRGENCTMSAEAQMAKPPSPFVLPRPLHSTQA